MFVVEKINDILQTIYQYVPQELVIIILAGLFMGVLMNKEYGKEEKEILKKQIHFLLYLFILTFIWSIGKIYKVIQGGEH